MRRALQGPVVPHGTRCTGYGLLVGPWQYQSGNDGWVLYPVYHPPGTPPGTPTLYYPSARTTPVRPSSSPTRTLARTKEILGVNNAL